MKLTATQISAAKKCKSPEEVVEKAKEQGIELTLEEAKEVLVSPEIVRLDEDDLDSISGGCGGGAATYQTVTCGICGGTATLYYSNNGYHYYSCHAVKLDALDYGHITVYKGANYSTSYCEDDD